MCDESRKHGFGGELGAVMYSSTPSEHIFGKEVQQPKYETLRQLIKTVGCDPKDVWFVEDRLKALESVKQQPDLLGVGLFLASWGYNTEQAREIARYDQDIHLISLEQFLQDFSLWQST